MSSLREEVIAVIRKVHDPEIPVNIYDLGLIYTVDVNDDGAVSIEMTLTSPNCPVAEALPQQVREKVAAVDGVTSANVEVVWEPAWTSEKITEDARLQLDMMGIDWADPVPKSPFTPMTFGKQKRPPK